MMVIRIAGGVRSHFVTRMHEWGFSAGLFAIGLVLVTVGDVFRAAPGYRLLATWVSEILWGRIALGISSVWLAALIINGTFKTFRRWSPWARSLCALMASAFWAVDATAIFLAKPLSPMGMLCNAILAYSALASSLVSAREVGVIEGNVQRCSRRQSPRKKPS